MNRSRAGLTIALLFASVEARAAPPAPSAAEALFEEGRTLVLSGRFAEACPRLAQSLQLDPGVGTMLWLADCYEKDGQLAAAWTQFKGAATFAASHEDGRAGVAQRRAFRLEERLTRIIVILLPDRNVDGLLVQRDGVPVSSHELQSGSVVLPVEPRSHTITATAPGRIPWHVTVLVPTTPGAVTVHIPLLVLPEARGEPEPPLPTPRVPLPGPASTGTSMLRVTGISLGALGLASAAAGAYFGLDARATYDASNEGGHCSPDQTCDAEGKRLRADATSAAMLSTIAFGASAGALVTGLVLYLLAPSSRTRAPTLALTPTVGPRTGGLAFAHRW